MSVVASTSNRSQHRVPQAAAYATSTLAEVTRILAKKTREHGIAEHIPIEGVRRGSPPSFEIALSALAVAGVFILELTDSGIHAGDHERNRIGPALERQ